jgi:hypothetical protein
MAKFPNEIKVKADGELLQLLEQISKKLDEQDERLNDIEEFICKLDDLFSVDAFQRLRARRG